MASGFIDCKTWCASYLDAEGGCAPVSLKVQDEPVGLQIKAPLQRFEGFPVVEWTLRLRNIGECTSALISDIQSLDTCFKPQDFEPVVHYARGGSCCMDDYMPLQRILNMGGQMRVQPGAGRSSSDYLPFFNLQLSPDSGVIIAIGWSGEWAAEFIRNEDGTVQVRAGMAHTNLKLEPGEEIRQPLIMLLFWQGSMDEAHNTLRRFILQNHRPKMNGVPLHLPLYNGNWGATSARMHLENIEQIIKNDLPVEYYWIDAEWFGEGPWYLTVGDWTPKADIYPQGFRPIADALHAAGRKLLVWFEPERVCEGTPWYTELSDWLLTIPQEKRHYNWGTSQCDPDWTLWESLRNQIRDNDRLFNFGIPEACEFITNYMAEQIEIHGIDCFRHDANISTLEFWLEADTPEREGMTEIRWVEGLYKFWDGLLERFPNLMIDNCASGGRRIDLESMSRTIPLWRTDFPGDPIGRQCHTWGISRWVPLNSTGAVNPGTQDDYTFRTAQSATVCFGLFSLGDFPQPAPPAEDYPYEHVREVLNLAADLAKYYEGDYYPLTAYSQAADAWMGWQLHRDDLKTGIIQMFKRPLSSIIKGKFKLSGLDETATYSIVNVDTNEVVEKSGVELMTDGLVIKIVEQPYAMILKYQQI